MSVTVLASTYTIVLPVYTLKQGAIRLFVVDIIIYIMWISLKMLYLKVLATFSDHHGFLHFLSSSCLMKETVAASFQD